MTKFVFVVGLLASLSGHVRTAQAQIFGGISDSGAVVLSNISSDEARTLIVAAPSAASGAASGMVVKPSLSGPATAPPKVFQSFVLEASIASRLPAELIHAVIKAESNYNPQALSGKGAQGLMQLMPDTAKRFGSTDSLDPRVNILTGSRYLRWLMDYFNQNIELAVAAYNAGEALSSGPVTRCRRSRKRRNMYPRSCCITDRPPVLLKRAASTAHRKFLIRTRMK